MPIYRLFMTLAAPFVVLWFAWRLLRGREGIADLPDQRKGQPGENGVPEPEDKIAHGLRLAKGHVDQIFTTKACPVCKTKTDSGRFKKNSSIAFLAPGVDGNP